MPDSQFHIKLLGGRSTETEDQVESTNKQLTRHHQARATWLKNETNMADLQRRATGDDVWRLRW